MSSMTPSRLGRLLFVCAVAATIHGASRADDALVVTASDLVIAERGKAPKYDIVIPAKPTVWQRHAASELRKWTKELTGVELAICEGKGEAPCHVRLIEPEPHLALGDEGFNLRTEKSDVVVRGGRRGMLYGVNELLETYGGIGWFSPWRTVVPKTGVLKVPDSLYDTQRPAFEMRYTDFYWCGDNDWSGQNVEPKREFFVHCRQNGAFKIRLQEKYGGFTDAGLFAGGADRLYAQELGAEGYGHLHSVVIVSGMASHRECIELLARSSFRSSVTAPCGWLRPMGKQPSRA